MTTDQMRSVLASHSDGQLMALARQHDVPPRRVACIMARTFREAHRLGQKPRDAELTDFLGFADCLESGVFDQDIAGILGYC